MSADHDELTLLKDTLERREEELRSCKQDAADKEEQIRDLKEELEQSRAKLEEKIERLSTLIDVAASISSTLDLDQLLRYVMTCATKVMKAKDSSLMLIDERTNELVFKIALGEKSAQIQEFRIRMGQGIAGEVALTGEPLVVSDTSKDKRFDRSVDMATGFDTKSIMCVPIKLRDKVVGVIEVLNAGYSGTLSEEDLDIFNAFASAAGIALQNARLFAAIQYSFEHICDLVNSGALMTDENGELVMINSIARNLLGFDDTEEITIRSISRLKADSSISSLLEKAFDEAKTVVEEIGLEDNGGKRIKIEITPVIDPNGMKIGTVAVLSGL